MFSIEARSKHDHTIENKGPESFWVHRFQNTEGRGKRFSRVVYFARSKQDAEDYVKTMEKSAELK